MILVDGVEMLDVRETARLAGRTPETVRRWIWAGRLTSRKHGSRLLVTRRDVDALLAGGARPESAPTLAGWAQMVAEQRRTGALADAPRATSAADVILDDRSRRQAG